MSIYIVWATDGLGFSSFISLHPENGVLFICKVAVFSVLPQRMLWTQAAVNFRQCHRWAETELGGEITDQNELCSSSKKLVGWAQLKGAAKRGAFSVLFFGDQRRLQRDRVCLTKWGKTTIGMTGEGSEDPQQVLCFTWSPALGPVMGQLGAARSRWASRPVQEMLGLPGQEEGSLLQTTGTSHPREDRAQRISIHVCKYLMRGCRGRTRLLSGIQWKDKRRWAQLEIQKMLFKCEKTFWQWGCLKTVTGFQERLWILHPRSYWNLAARGPGQPAVDDPALSKG